MDGTPQYASFWKRFNAYGVDVIFIQCAVVLVMALCYRWPTLEEVVQGAAGKWFELFTNYTLLLSAVYNIGFVSSRWQATLGKRSLRIIVVNKDGSRLTPIQSAFRHLASGLSMAIGGLGCLTVFFTREKTALHDMMCNTRVIAGKIE